MGTSSSFKGQLGSTPLVPSWLNQDPLQNIEIKPNEIEIVDPIEQNIESDPESDNNNDKEKDLEKPVNIDNKRFQSSRSNFTSYIKSGKNYKLNKAVRNYVKNSNKGSKNATLRMGKASKSVSRLASIFTGFLNNGINQTLKNINFTNLVGKTFSDVLYGLSDFICPNTGNIPDSIINEAFSETLAKVFDMNIDIENIKKDELLDILNIFISETIKARILNDIGTGIIKNSSPEKLDENFEDISNFIEGHVKDITFEKLSMDRNLNDDEIENIVNDIYKTSFEIMEELGE